MNTIELPLQRNSPADAKLQKKTTQLAAGFELLSRKFIERAEQKALDHQKQIKNELKQKTNSFLKSYFNQQISMQKKRLEESEEQIQELIINIAKEVVGEELKINPLSLRTRIQRALVLHNQGLPSVVTVSPGQKLLFEEVKTPLPDSIQLIACPDIALDDARIEYQNCVVELSPKKHFEEIWESLRSQQ